MFYFISVAVPVLIYLLLPRVLTRLTGMTGKNATALLIACVLFFISWYLPSPDIEGRNTYFMTHFVGGGLFCGFLWVYVRQYLKTKIAAYVDLLAIYVLVSTLGVINELFELFVTQARIVELDPSDTWWDLLANTLGGLLFWLAYVISKVLDRLLGH